MTTATQLIERAKAQGATIRLERDSVKVTASAPLPEPLMSELRQHKAELLAYLSSKDRCLACVCNDPITQLSPLCPLCQGYTCAKCGQCTAYRRGWVPGWVERDMLDRPLPELLDRLRSGQRWLQEKDEAEYTGELFGKMLAVWDEIEIVLRHVHEFKGCIHGGDATCPEDAPVRCCVCVPIPETDAHE